MKKLNKRNQLLIFFVLLFLCFVFEFLIVFSTTIKDVFLNKEINSKHNSEVKEMPTYYGENEESHNFFQHEERKGLLESSQRIREEGVGRFFLSKIVIIDERYVPIIHSCLFDQDGKPLYPLYVYNFRSTLSYPKHLPPETALVKYLLLPEDNYYFQPNKSCYIREIISEEDWKQIEEMYGFFRELF